APDAGTAAVERVGEVAQHVRLFLRRGDQYLLTCAGRFDQRCSDGQTRCKRGREQQCGGQLHAGGSPAVQGTWSVGLRGRPPALGNVDLALYPGELAFLVGPSGAGKTTLLRLINRESRPTSGQVWVAGIGAHELKASQVPGLRRRVGVVFQDFKLLPRLTALE